MDQEPAGGEGVVADHFGIHAKARTPAHQPVGRILFQGVFCGRGRLAVGGRQDHLTEEAFDIPAMLHEVDRQPVEKGLIGRQVTHDTQVFGRADDAGSEDLRPKAIDRDARGQRVFGRHQPLGQTQTIGGRTSGQGVEGLENRTAHRIALLVVLPAVEHIGHGHGVGLLALDVGDWIPAADFGALLLEGGDRRLGLLQGQELRLKTRQEAGTIVLGPVRRRLGEERAKGFGGRPTAGFGRAQGAGVNSQVLDGSAGEHIGLVTLTQFQRHPGADRASHGGRPLLEVGCHAIDIQAHTVSTAGAVAGQQDMLPLALLGQRLAGADLEGVLGPAVHQMRAEGAVLVPQIPTAISLGVVHAGQQRPGGRGLLGHEEPAAERERLAQFEVARIGKSQRLARVGEQGCPEGTTGFPRRLAGGLEGLRASGHSDGHGGARALVERGFERQVSAQRRLEFREFQSTGPSIEGAFCVLLAGLHGLLGGLKGPRQSIPPGAVLGIGHQKDAGLGILHIAIEPALLGVPEEGRHRIKILLADRVELVIVACRAVGGEPEPHPRRGGDPVVGVVREVFLFDGTALVGGHVAPVEPGGDLLLFAGPGQQVPGDLLHGEPVEGQVAIEGPDDPIAVGPHLAVVVEVQAVRVGVAGGIEPIAGAVLTPLGRVHEAIDPALVGVGARVADELFHPFGPRRQTGEVEGGAPREAPTVGLGIGLEPLGFEPGQNERIQPTTNPASIFHRR